MRTKMPRCILPAQILSFSHFVLPAFGQSRSMNSLIGRVRRTSDFRTLRGEQAEQEIEKHHERHGNQEPDNKGAASTADLVVLP